MRRAPACGCAYNRDCHLGRMPMRLRFTIRFAICAVLYSALLFGQGGRPSTAPATGVSPTMIPPITRGRALTGKFMLEDGTAPPDRVRVELTCNSFPRPQGYSDDKGNFSVQLANNNPDQA